jgi:hypothetical protein
MARTPEGHIKEKVSRLLSKVTELYYFMPVPGGFSASTLDYICCHRGRFFAIETKAPGKHPTPRQRSIMASMIRAGAKVFIIDSTDLSELEDWLYEGSL